MIRLNLNHSSNSYQRVTIAKCLTVPKPPFPLQNEDHNGVYLLLLFQRLDELTKHSTILDSKSSINTGYNIQSLISDTMKDKMIQERYIRDLDVRYLVAFFKPGPFSFLIADSYHEHKYQHKIPETVTDLGSNPDLGRRNISN